MRPPRYFLTLSVSLLFSTIKRKINKKKGRERGAFERERDVERVQEAGGGVRAECVDRGGEVRADRCERDEKGSGRGDGRVEPAQRRRSARQSDGGIRAGARTSVRDQPPTCPYARTSDRGGRRTPTGQGNTRHSNSTASSAPPLQVSDTLFSILFSTVNSWDKLGHQLRDWTF